MGESTSTDEVASISQADDADFLSDFVALSAIGATGAGGVHREAATEADGQTRTWLCDWFERNSFRTAVDSVGNVFGTIDWVPGAPYVVVGSHLDSQPTAGKFDGAYGVLAAAHAALRAARAVQRGEVSPRLNLAVANWFNEEGSRFVPSLMGSGVYTGKFDAEQILQVQDLAGTTVREALQAIGFQGSDTPPPAASYAEIHIEQGRTLEAEGASIGIVTANWAARKYSISVLGEQSHTGATHMAYRHDALVGASQLVLAARELTTQFPAGDLLASVGRLNVIPNSPVVVPATVTLSLDLRSHDAEVLEEAHERLLRALEGITARGEVRVSIDASSLRPSTSYQPEGIALAVSAAERLGLSYRKMLTMAGHDSVNLKDVVPTVMLFVPSVEGVSHSQKEQTSDADLLHGVRMLTETTRLMLSAGPDLAAGDYAVAGTVGSDTRSAS